VLLWERKVLNRDEDVKEELGGVLSVPLRLLWLAS
jgi:hypothetical protein